MIDKVGGKIFPFGSYHLGVHSKDADINALCVGPGFLERKAFFTSFFKKLKAQKEVKDIQANEEAYVPVIKLSWEGIEIGLVLALVTQSSVADDLDLLNDSIVKDMDERCVRSLDGRYIYSNKMGFLGGVSWAIMVARICQVYPNAAASTLVIKFFSIWVWPVPIRLKVVENCYYNLPFWNPGVNVSDCYHLMPVISPAYPQQNTSANVSLSTFAIINKEIRRGHAICQEIEQKKANWRKLFEEMDFFDKYQHYVMLEAPYSTEKQRTEWVCLVESKIGLLVASLERNVVSLVHVHLRSFPRPRRANKEDGKSTVWLVGLAFNPEGFQIWINLNTIFQTFANTINSLAKRSNLYEKGKFFTAAYMQKEELVCTLSHPTCQLRGKRDHSSANPRCQPRN
ncbi:poly(A) polymerase beta-like [Archocentrus centrarchus]|uniref:poly(A) polymerase beta-like n=1 Tax=Archocentrus centrarchus TaxID=63155 RepID=UPI0011EA3B89|nr:poly(A) polymerase beta-like [Archocentrus centrarchus]